MNKEQQKTILGEFYAHKKNVMKLKSEDYASDKDVLSNFKSAGENIGISAELQCLSLIATKVARLGNLFSGKKPNNESVSDSILDLSNYTDLLYCLVNEQITDKVESVTKQRKDKFNENLVNEIAKLSKAMGGKKNTNPECECTEIPTEYKPTYEAKTKRWENVSDEPIKEPYEPKAGDRFEDENGIILNVKNVVGGFVVCQYKNNGDLMITYLWLSDFLDKIKSGTLTKIN